MPTILEEVESRVYPGLDKSPKKNWVDKVGGLPSYIERVAKHLHYEKGRSISTAIATAINHAKKMCATGRAFGGKVSVSAKARAVACKAVAEWEAKKARAHAQEALSDDSVYRAVERLVLQGASMSAEEEEAIGRAAQREVIAAARFLQGEGREDVRLGLIEALVADYYIAENMGLNPAELNEAVSSTGVHITRTPIRPGSPKGRDGRQARDAEFEKKHPRAVKGRTGGGQFIQKGDTGAAVRGLQRELGLSGDELTGEYDERTERAVRAFQREHGLQVDGVIGSQTAGLMQDRAGVAPGELGEGDKEFLRSRARDTAYSRQRRRVTEAEDQTQVKPEGGGETELHLKPGTDGERVNQMQARLNTLGYRVQADGKFGERTEAAVRQFQREQGLAEDGVVGDQTIEAMRTVDTSKRGDLYRKGDGVVGEVHEGVRELQDTLAVAGFETEVDGRFGPETERQVRRLQRRYGLRIDGIAGPRTLALLDRIGRRQKSEEKADPEKKDKEPVVA